MSRWVGLVLLALLLLAAFAGIRRFIADPLNVAPGQPRTGGAAAPAPETSWTVAERVQRPGRVYYSQSERSPLGGPVTRRTGPSHFLILRGDRSGRMVTFAVDDAAWRRLVVGAPVTAAEVAAWQEVPGPADPPPPPGFSERRP